MRKILVISDITLDGVVQGYRRSLETGGGVTKETFRSSFAMLELCNAPQTTY